MVEAVGTWLNKMKSALSGDAEIAARVRRELQALQRSRAKLIVTVTNPVTNEQESLATMVEQVREADLIISQPSSGAATRPLATGERVQLQFATAGGLTGGEARVLGRIKLPSGGKRMFFGYRVTVPEFLRTIERRQHERIRMERGSAPIVHLLPTIDGERDPTATLTGHILDISLGGTQVLVAEPVAIKQGDKLKLDAEFPPPVGAVVHPVTVMRVEKDPNTNETRVGLHFSAPVPNLDQLIEQLKLRPTRGK